MIICILQKGAMGTPLYLNSKEEQIILDHVSHTEHGQLKPEQMAIFLGTLPGAVCQCLLRHWSCFGFSQIIWLTQTSAVCWERIPIESQTNIRDRPCCTGLLSKLYKTGARGPQCVPISDQYRQQFSHRYLYVIETFHSHDIWSLSSIHRKGKIIFLLNKLRNVNSVTSLKQNKTKKNKTQNLSQYL